MEPDHFNGLFEFIAGCLIWMSVWQLNHDKCVKGVHPWPVAFFALWGYWNLYYYPHLDQWFSLIGGINVVVANTIWVLQMIYYLRQERDAE